MPASGSPRELGGQVGGFFPAPSPAFGCHQPGPSRTSPGARFRVASHPSSALRTVPETAAGRSPTALLRSFRTRPGPSRPESGAEAPSPTRTLPLLGFVTLLPLHRHIQRASTPSRSGLPRFSLRADGTTRPAPVPSSWFRTTSTAFSARRTVGLLHPTAGPGVRRVSRNLLPRPWPVACATSRDEPEAVPWDRGEEGLVPAT
jgi:hypothetical protein